MSHIEVACVASVSVWFRIKERPRNRIFGFGHGRNETRAKKWKGRGGQTFYWSIMTASNDSVRTQAWQAKWVVFKIPRFALEHFLPFFPSPSRSFTCATFHVVFDSHSSFFAPKPHRNACYAGCYRRGLPPFDTVSACIQIIMEVNEWEGGWETIDPEVKIQKWGLGLTAANPRPLLNFDTIL